MFEVTSERDFIAIDTPGYQWVGWRPLFTSRSGRCVVWLQPPEIRLPRRATPHHKHLHILLHSLLRRLFIGWTVAAFPSSLSLSFYLFFSFQTFVKSLTAYSYPRGIIQFFFYCSLSLRNVRIYITYSKNRGWNLFRQFNFLQWESNKFGMWFLYLPKLSFS